MSREESFPPMLKFMQSGHSSQLTIYDQAMTETKPSTMQQTNSRFGRGHSYRTSSSIASDRAMSIPEEKSDISATPD